MATDGVYDLINMDGNYMRPPPPREAGSCSRGGSSRFHDGLGIWFCAHCGVYAHQQIGKLGDPCDTPTPTGREYLGQVNLGLWPKVLRKGEQSQRKRGSPK